MATTISSSVAATTSTATASAKAASTSAASAKKSAAQSLMTKLGSGSGVDLNSLATSLVDAERAAQTESINRNISKNEARISGYSALKMTIDTVKSAFDALQKPSSVNLMSATSSNSAAVTISTGTGAIPGSHDISIAKRAQGQRNLSTGFAATDTKLSNNDFYLQLTVAGKPKMIKVAAASATPAGMVTAINNANLGVTAQLINTGDGSGTPYKIVLNGSTGAGNSFSLVTDDGSGSSEQQQLRFTTALANGAFKIGDVSVSVKSGDTGSAIATAAKAALEAADTANGVSGRSYTVNLDGTLTIEYAKTDGDMDPVKVTDPQYTGVNTAVTTVRAFSAGKPLSATDLQKKQTLTFGPANGQGAITIGGVTVNLLGSESAIEVAGKVAAAFADPSNSTALGGKQITAPGDGSLRVVYPFSDGDASLTFADGAPPTGVSVSTQTTQAYTPKTALVNIDFSEQRQPAEDAEFTLNGILMHRSSNSITDAIPGVTLNLLGTTTLTGAATLTVERDTNALRDKVKALVDAVNTTMSDLGILSGPKNKDDPNDLYSGSLQNDSTVQLVKSQLRSLMLNNSASPGASIKALRDIGVSVDKVGTMTFDETKFNAAATANFDEVVTMLTANKESKSQYSTAPQGLAGDAFKRLTDLTKNTGYIQLQSDSAQKGLERYKAQLTAVEARLTRLQQQYTKTFANLDSLVGSINSQKTSLKSTFDAMNNANKG